MNTPIPADLHAAIRAAMHKGNGFAESLLTQYNRFGRLSDRQIAAARKAFMTPAPSGIPAKAIVDTLHAARQHLKFPKVRARTDDGTQKVVFSVAGDRAKMPGSINVTDGGPYGENQWFGRIDPATGTFTPSRSATDAVIAVVRAFAADPENFASVQGLKFGTCACCGRELTNPESVARGIGPICAERFFGG